MSGDENMQIYLVGGAVRDRLLGLPVTDRDWVVVGGSAAAMRERGFQQVGKDFPVFLHPDTREEYALARRERKRGHGHTGFEFDTDSTVSLEEDLMRRDLTINAMAQRDDGTVIDPWGGRGDLAAGLLRHVSPAFAEDPLRVLRVARFAARFADRGFRIHPETLSLMRRIAASGELQTLPAARIWQETARALMEATPALYWQVLVDCGASDILFPGITSLIDTPAHRHALPAAAAADAPLPVRFALSIFGIDAARQSTLMAIVQPPKDCARLANALNDSGLIDEVATAEELLSIFESVDYLRRPEGLEQFLQAQVLLGLSTSYLERLRDGIAAMRGVDNRALMDQGLSGKALGDALREARRRALEDNL